MNPPKTRAGSWARALGGLVLGLLIGVFLHYLAYRYALPSKPFIYVSF
ncbi:MAG TPA: hypothetical protein VGF85_04680 [Opitutaceae bacterium]